MTPFTDEDLKRLKHIMEWEDKYVKHDDIVDLINPLLVRLEAAEKAARWFNSLTPHDDSEPFRDYQAWRKAAGKD